MPQCERAAREVFWKMSCVSGGSNPAYQELKDPEEKGCCGGSNNGYQGYKIWNSVLLMLGVVMVIEAAFCFSAGVNHKGEAIVAVTAGGEKPPRYSLGDVQLAIGLCLASVGLTQLLLGFLSVVGCCDKSRLHGCCATCVHALYFTVSSLLIAVEVVLSLAMFVLQDWDQFKGNFEIDIQMPADEGNSRANMNLVLCGFMVELILAVFVQVGAMVFHVTYASGSDQHYDDYETSEGNESESFTEKRLAHMRKYYADLYRENGLKVPSELQGTDHGPVV